MLTSNCSNREQVDQFTICPPAAGWRNGWYVCVTHTHTIHHGASNKSGRTRGRQKKKKKMLSRHTNVKRRLACVYIIVRIHTLLYLSNREMEGGPREVLNCKKTLTSSTCAPLYGLHRHTHTHTRGDMGRQSLHVYTHTSSHGGRRVSARFSLSPRPCVCVSVFNHLDDLHVEFQASWPRRFHAGRSRVLFVQLHLAYPRVKKKKKKKKNGRISLWICSFFSPIICCVPLGIPGYSNSSMGGHRAENDKRLRSAANVQ